MQIEHALETDVRREEATYMKDGDGHREVVSTSNIEAQRVADPVEQLEVLGAPIDDGD